MKAAGGFQERKGNSQMKYCPNCGCENEDFSSLCSNCGGALSSAASAGKKKRNRGSRNILKVIAAVAAVGALGGGIFVGAKLLGGNALSKAYQRTTNAMVEDVNEQKGIAAVTKQLEKYESQGKYSLEIGYQNSALETELLCDYSRGAKLMDGDLRYADGQLEVDVTYSVKRDEIQFTIPGVVEDVYGFSVNDLGKKLDNSPVGKILPVDFTALSDINFFQKTNVAKSLDKFTNGKLNVLKDSIKIEYLDKRTVSIGNRSENCKMYQVTWNEQAVDELLQSLSGNPVLSKLAGFIKDIIPKIDGDCRCYINKDGYIVGIDLVSLGSKYFFVMEGEENPWDKFSLTITSLYGETKEYTGGLFNTDTGVQIYLKNQEELFFGTDYTNDGEFSIYTDKFGTIAFGTILSEGERTYLEVNLNSSTMGTQKFTCAISALNEKPEQLAKYHVDLLDMGLADWQRLLLDLGISASSFG